MNNFTKRLTLLFYHDKDIYLYKSFLIESFGKVIFVNSYEDALKEYREHHIDIVILELNLQYDKKFTYLKYVKEENPLNPVLVLSDDETVDTISHVVKLVIDGYYKVKFKKYNMVLIEIKLFLFNAV